MVFKVLMKVVANRLKPYMNLWIEEPQAHFIPRRHIVDNIVVAQKVVHSFHKKQGQKGWMMVKIDLEKAYDRLRWEFIYDSLVEAQIPENIIDILVRSWKANSSHVLWNDTCSDKFFPSRGVRQGPLAPYLFVLCIERLAHGIKHAVEHEMWKPIRLGKHGPPLTHLFFADDLILLAEASESQIEVIKGVLEDFYACSGGKQEGSSSKMEYLLQAKSTMRTRGSYHIMRNGCSNLWRSMSRLWSEFMKNVRWTVGDGASISLWFDIWLGDLPLFNIAVEEGFPVDMIDRVQDFKSPNGEWDKECLTTALPMEVVEKVLYLILPSLAAFLDEPYWALTSSGHFTISSAYDHLKSLSDSVRSENKRVRRGLSSDASCPQCHVLEETNLHLLRDCLAAAWRNSFVFEGGVIPIEGQLNIIKSWVPSPADWIAVISDRAYKSGKGVASTGGVLRHPDGSWIVGYVCKSRTSTANWVALWGVFQGLKLAWDHGYKRIQVQVDNKTVVKAFNTRATHPYSNSDMIKQSKPCLVDNGRLAYVIFIGKGIKLQTT
ncbi:Uncharacterized protein TCM_017202 [Theobroma cacao]|uniref:Reverse transcriptase domain-containing protein n=1 Tax=Theobroma cacao TaxID=3641 RepID=A0A061EDV7_THECC|nr:Uncharacterized protein TCM_017202 [Theobroma cacao]